MSKRWHHAKDELPERDLLYDSVSYEVIVETKDGTQLWAFCEPDSGQWYRTDGNPIDNVKRWRYGNEHRPVIACAESDNV